MIALTVGELAAATGGRVVDGAHSSDQRRVTGPAFVDSRAPEPNGVFVAIAGERANGHEFAASAMAAGAATTLVERPVGVPGAVLVDDTVAALGRLARHVVSQLPGLVVVGITGSQGKTGTKDILAQLLERFAPTVAPTGSYNNEIGLPLTATRVEADTRYLVAEMGARGGGHISHLTSLVPPRIGVVLNVGVAHIGEFGSREAIAAAKGELLAALPADGVAVLNADDPLVVAMRDRTTARLVTFGRDPDADVRVGGVCLDELGRPGFLLTASTGSARVRLPLVGEHQALNAAAAVAVTTALGLPVAEVAEALGTVRARSRWRMEVTTSSGGVTVINDAYNANPDSTRAALRTLAQIARRRQPPARAIAVLGEMRELGATSTAEHEAIGRLAAELGISTVVAVVPAAADVFRGTSSDPLWQGRALAAADPAAAAQLLVDTVRPGDVVLVKASRAAGLETVAAALVADSASVSGRQSTPPGVEATG